MDIQALIDKAGGRDKLRSICDVGRTTILDWERLGRIPANRVAQISAALDIPLCEVIKLAPAPRGRSAESV